MSKNSSQNSLDSQTEQLLHEDRLNQLLEKFIRANDYRSDYRNNKYQQDIPNSPNQRIYKKLHPELFEQNSAPRYPGSKILSSNEILENDNQQNLVNQVRSSRNAQNNYADNKAVIGLYNDLDMLVGNTHLGTSAPLKDTYGHSEKEALFNALKATYGVDDRGYLHKPWKPDLAFKTQAIEKSKYANYFNQNNPEGTKGDYRSPTLTKYEKMVRNAANWKTQLEKDRLHVKGITERAPCGGHNLSDCNPWLSKTLPQNSVINHFTNTQYPPDQVKQDVEKFNQKIYPTNHLFKQGLQQLPSYNGQQKANSWLATLEQPVQQQNNSLAQGDNNQNLNFGSNNQQQSMMVPPPQNQYGSINNLNQPSLSTFNNQHSNQSLSSIPNPSQYSQQMAKGGSVRSKSADELLAQFADFQRMVQGHQAQKQPRPAPKQELTFDDMMRLRQYLDSLDSERYRPNNPAYLNQQTPVQPISLLDYMQQGVPAKTKPRFSPSIADFIKPRSKPKPRSRLFEIMSGLAE